MWVVTHGQGTTTKELSFSNVHILTDNTSYAEQGGVFITEEIFKSGIVEIEEM